MLKGADHKNRDQIENNAPELTSASHRQADQRELAAVAQRCLLHSDPLPTIRPAMIKVESENSPSLHLLRAFLFHS
jgi:hypothetical protein